MASVQDIQSKLNDLGFGPLTVDGANGPKTQAAIKAFQASKNLTIDGVVGPQTLAALGLTGASVPSGALTGGSTPQSKTFGKPFKPVSAPSIPGMKQAAADAFAPANVQFEGNTPFLYTDSKGYVTTAIGVKVDDGTSGPALALQWQRPDGSIAPNSEVDAAWHVVKNAWPGVQSVASAKLTTIRLTDKGVAQAVSGHLKGDVGTLTKRYPSYASFPADGQLALNFISWAWGPAFSGVWGQDGKNFDAAINQLRPDFLKAADIMKNSSIVQHEEKINPGIIPRNAAIEWLFSNADAVLKGNGDPDNLYFPLAYSAKKLSFFAVGGLLLGTGIAVGVSKYKGWI